MSVLPALSLHKRVPPAAWIGLAWCLLVADLGFGAGSSGFGPDWALIGVCSAIALAGILLERRRPLISIAALTLASFATTDVTDPRVQLPLSALLPVCVALFFVTVTRPARTSRFALAFVLGVLVVLVVYLGQRSYSALGLTTATYDGWPARTLFEIGRYHVTTTLPQVGAPDKGLLLVVIAWLAGLSLRRAREHAEAMSAQVVRREVVAERLRIAREMHDTVAHSIGIIALQAGAARRVINNRPDRAREALTEIETAGRQTLSSLRRALGALREADEEVDRPATPTHRLPGLVDLDRLAAATTAAGVQVDVRWEGKRRRLPAEVDLAALRIAQESIANVVRHADATSCEVIIDYRKDDEVTVEITDAGRGHHRDPGSGFGLTGLRERVALLHGEFRAGPRSNGGFQVYARLPVPVAAR